MKNCSLVTDRRIGRKLDLTKISKIINKNLVALDSVAARKQILIELRCLLAWACVAQLYLPFFAFYCFTLIVPVCAQKKYGRGPWAVCFLPFKNKMTLRDNIEFSLYPLSTIM